MRMHPVQAGLEERPAVRQLRLAALAVGAPFHVLRGQQQMQVVMTGQQFAVEPAWVVAKQRLAPEPVGQQVSIEDQQRRAPGARRILQANWPRAIAGISARQVSR